jgi:hypothetical protein
MSAPSPPVWLLIAIYFLYLGLATTASVPLFADIDWMHEGERLGTAQVILDGGLPLRDVYLPHGLFDEAIRPLLAFSIFGESLAADRLVGLMLEPLAYVAAAVYVWNLFRAPAWRIVGLAGFALYPLLLVPRHIAVFLMLSLLTAWVYERRPALLFWAGLVSGLATVFSTFDQAAFLFATALLFPVVLMAERVMREHGVAGRNTGPGFAATATLFQMVRPLLTGLSLGLIPLLGYMGLTGTISTFLSDVISRGQADAYAFTHVWGHQSVPPLTTAYMIWYAIPALYIILAVTIIVRVYYWGDRYWTAVWPTLLFGILSFVYAVRAYTYWKLAVVSFPFIVSVVYILYAIRTMSMEKRQARGLTGMSAGDILLVGLSAMSMIILLVHTFTRDWNIKQVAPRFLFPALALAILAAAVLAFAGLIRRRWHGVVVVACPLAALIVAVWFYNDAKPQLLSAQLKKPRLVSDGIRLVDVMATAEGRLTRDDPPYVRDETLTYMRAAAREHRPVVMLAPGAGNRRWVGSVQSGSLSGLR